MKYIIKPFAEIMVKSKPVKKRYLSFLQTNINLGLKKIDKTYKVIFLWDKFELNISNEIVNVKIIEILSRIPGIEFFLEVEEFIFDELEDIIKKIILVYKDDLENKSFVVRVKRTGVHNFKSIDAERYIGGKILRELPNTKVDLHKPNIILNIEINNNKFYLIKKKYYGIGGYPVGTQDKVISLISGGFDSTVSSFSMIKRGCKLDYLFFNLGGEAHELGVKEVSKYINDNFSYGYDGKFISVPFENLVSFIIKNINHKYRGIILKRCFLMIADKIAEKYNYFAIVKGDSLGQVSSQTLKNMFIIDKSSKTLVLRPLISFNKQEIINLSMKIGTYEYACSMPEYCGVISDKPATGAKLENIIKEEEKIPIELIEKAYKNIIIEDIANLIKKEKDGNIEVEVVSLLGKEDIVIDIREEPKEKEKPLLLDSNNLILKIPFFDILDEYGNLDNTKTYLLYCDKGIMSKNFAISLKEKGYINIKIYKPILNKNSCKIKFEN